LGYLLHSTLQNVDFVNTIMRLTQIQKIT
jgi:hypothetical protein